MKAVQCIVESWSEVSWRACLLFLFDSWGNKNTNFLCQYININIMFCLFWNYLTLQIYYILCSTDYISCSKQCLMIYVFKRKSYSLLTAEDFSPASPSSSACSCQSWSLPPGWVCLTCLRLISKERERERSWRVVQRQCVELLK